MDDYTYKEHNIYDNGFDENLIKGKEMPPVNMEPIHRAEREKKESEERLKILRGTVKRDKNLKERKEGAGNENIKYWISYTKNRDVVLNDKYIINTMQFERSSDCWFDYIFNNPNKKIPLEKIRDETKTECTGGFNKFLDSIKFKGQLRKLFFKQGKLGIVFYNPITEKDFEEMVSLDIEKLRKEINKLKKIENPK